MKSARALFLVIFAPILLKLSTSLEFKYHNKSELEKFLVEFQNETNNAESPLKTRLYSIGKSYKKNELWVLEITAAKEDKQIGIPNVKFIGNIHGNEPAGREILLHFLEYLKDNYASDLKIQHLLNATKLHFLPALNPDGFAMASEGLCRGDYGRDNGDGKDLNRNFPDYHHKNRIPIAPETVAVKRWMDDTYFILSASLHSGAVVANYPFDNVKEKKWQNFFRKLKKIVNNSVEVKRLRHEYIASLAVNPPSLTPDDDVFKHLATVYSQNHLTMHKGEMCNNHRFEGGIINGAAWYPFTGGMQDFNYAMHGCMELTLEISCCKYPEAKQLPIIWEQNKMALLNYCLEAHRGVTGQILDLITKKPIKKANLKISGRDMIFFSNKNGEFWRLLLPGKYKLEISAEGYYDYLHEFIVEDFKASFPKLTFLNISLLNSSISTTSSTTQKILLSNSTESSLLDGIMTGKRIISPRFNANYEDDEAIAEELSALEKSSSSSPSSSSFEQQIFNLALLLLLIYFFQQRLIC